MPTVTPGIVFAVCDKHPAKSCALSSELTVLRDDLLGSMVKSPDSSLLDLQADAISNIVSSVAAGNNFLLADGMGMGKTVQGTVAASLLLKLGAVSGIVVVPPPTGAETWEATIACLPAELGEKFKVLPSLPSFLSGAHKIPEDYLVIFDEVHRSKNVDTDAGWVLASYNDSTKSKFACVAKILALSGSIVDKPDEVNAYLPLFKVGGDDMPTDPKKVIKSLHSKGMLCMRSLEYPDVDLQLYKVAMPVDAIDSLVPDPAAAGLSNPSGKHVLHGITHYPLALEKYFLQHHLSGVLERAVAGGRTPILLSRQINTDIAGERVDQLVGRVAQSAGLNYVRLLEHPDEQFMNDWCRKGPTLFHGTVNAMGTGSNLQDRHGEFPRELIISAVTFESLKFIQSCYRVIRPDSASNPKITLPTSDHPIHQFALGNLSAKFKDSPHQDATLKKFQEALGGVAPLAMTLKESARLFLGRTDAQLSDTLLYRFVECAGLTPTVKGMKRVVNLGGVPNAGKAVSLAQQFDRSFVVWTGKNDNLEVSILPGRGGEFKRQWGNYIRMLCKV